MWQTTRWLFASLFRPVYPYLKQVTNNPWRKPQTGENRGKGLFASGCVPAGAGPGGCLKAIRRQTTNQGGKGDDARATPCSAGLISAFSLTPLPG